MEHYDMPIKDILRCRPEPLCKVGIGENPDDDDLYRECRGTLTIDEIYPAHDIYPYSTYYDDGAG